LPLSIPPFPTETIVVVTAQVTRSRIENRRAADQHAAMSSFSRFLVTLLFAGLLAFPAAAAAPAPPRVLVVTGGHGFQQDPFLEVFKTNAAIAWTHLEHTKGTADVYDRADLAAYDVVLLYDMPRTITESQRAKFLGLFARGTGLVVTHHALCSYQDWPDYERIIGGRYLEKKAAVAAGLTPSGYEHDVDLPVVVAARQHPVTAGVADFTIHDEIYWGYRVGKDVTPLLTTPHPKSGNPLAWCRTEGKSRVVYLLLGHDAKAYVDPNYRRLLANAIRWVARSSQSENLMRGASTAPGR
jgi:type 1 glutamine amidotransferase